jgi:hypothetical protein
MVSRMRLDFRSCFRRPDAIAYGIWRCIYYFILFYFIEKGAFVVRGSFLGGGGRRYTYSNSYFRCVEKGVLGGTM